MSDLSWCLYLQYPCWWLSRGYNEVIGPRYRDCHRIPSELNSHRLINQRAVKSRKPRNILCFNRFIKLMGCRSIYFRGCCNAYSIERSSFGPWESHTVFYFNAFIRPLRDTYNRVISLACKLEFDVGIWRQITLICTSGIWRRRLSSHQNCNYGILLLPVFIYAIYGPYSLLLHAWGRLDS